MKYRELGNTKIMVSEIALGGEWLERQTPEAVDKIVDRCREAGINFIDCFMSEPNVRSNIGNAIKKDREKWIIQGHIGSAWRDGQYVRTRDLEETKAAFSDLLNRFHTDYMDFGMIHFVDKLSDWEEVINGGFFDYVKSLRDEGKIRHMGISTHNPEIARLAALTGEIKVILFSLNPAYDMLPATENIDDYFVEKYESSLSGIAKERAELYRLCEREGVGITVMKALGGGRLLDKEKSPFGVALTPAKCIHYCLTRPSVASVFIGFSETAHVDEALLYESANEEERDYASVLANAPSHAYMGECTYCGHCKPCPSGIDIAMVNKLYDLSEGKDEIPPTVYEHYMNLSAKASDCIGCSACEERCPFGVKVTERMKKCKDLLG